MPADGYTIHDADDDPAPRKPKKPRKPDRRANLAALLAKVDLWRSPDGVPYASVPHGNHREPMRVAGRNFRAWLIKRFYDHHGAGLSGQALAETVALAEARALASGCERRPWRRVAWHEGRIYLDLGGSDPAGERRAVEISAKGWKIIEPALVPVAFLRASDARALPEPEAAAAAPGDLRHFINVEIENDDLALIWAWIICALRPFPAGGAYPILFLHGEHGSGKSGAAQIVQALIDPSTLTGRAVPREEHDLAVTAGNRHLLAFDNLSHIGDNMADCLCRMATGGGFSARAKYTDADEVALSALNPLLLNGIPPNIIARPDLADRALSIELRPLLGERKRDAELATLFERLRPGLLGLTCDGLSAALCNFDRTTIADPPRMVDAATWAKAAASGLGFDPERVETAWRDNRNATDRAALAVDDVGQAVVALVEANAGAWKGSPADLYRELSGLMPERVTRSPLWPKSASGMASKLRRLAPALRAVHRIEATHGKRGAEGWRWWSVRKL